MKYLPTKIYNLLKRIYPWLINLCPTRKYEFNTGFVARYRYIIFGVITVVLLFIALRMFWYNWGTLAAILVLNNDIFTFSNFTAYVKFVGICSSLIFLCLIYIIYALYLLDYSYLSEFMLKAFVYVLVLCAIFLCILLFIYAYYGYIYLVHTKLLCYLENLSTGCLSLHVLVVLICFISIKHVVVVPVKINNFIFIIYISVLLIFFNLSLTYIFEPILLCKYVAWLLTTYCREVHIYLLCTLCYLYYLTVGRRNGIRCGWLNVYILVDLAGCALGARIGFRTEHVFINQCFIDFNFFVLSFIFFFLILLCLYFYLRFVVELFCWRSTFLNLLFISLSLFIVFFFIGLAITIYFTYTVHGVPLPISTFTLFK